MKTKTKIKNKLVDRIKKRTGKMTVAYFNMLLAGSYSCSYRMAKEIGRILETPPETWCDPANVNMRKVAFDSYVIKKSNGKR